MSGVLAYQLHRRLPGLVPDGAYRRRALLTGAVLFGLKAIGVPWLRRALLGPVVYGVLLVVTRSVDLGYLKAAVEKTTPPGMTPSRGCPH